ncbi:MAG: transferrin-binding protein-like solute binding protein [Rhodobacter sp.]|nr:transferrin-binding protein-like solute binding protein [Rhodobacter sp.]
MRTSKAKTGAVAIASALALAACGGGDGTTTAPPNPQHFQGKNDSLPNRISGATTAEEAIALTAMTVGVDYANGGATRAEAEEISVKIYRAASGAVPTVELTRGDDVKTFGPEHAPDGGNYQVPPSSEGVQDRRSLWMWAGYPIDHANGYYVNDSGERKSQRRKYHIPLGFWYDTETVDQDRYAVIGLRTPSADMPTHDITASYVGEVRMTTWAVEDGRDRADWESDLLLRADFAGGTVSGVVDRWEERLDGGGREYRDGVSYRIPETPITGNGFSGTLVAAPGCVDCIAFTTSTVAGGFYGPYAEEAGGTLQGEFTLDGSDHVMNGIFYSNR